MRETLGDEYTEGVRKLYEGSVPAFADLVCCWLHKAGALVAEGRLARAGLVATNSIRGRRNRAVLDRVVKDTTSFDAWSDEPWVVDGAADVTKAGKLARKRAMRAAFENTVLVVDEGSFASTVQARDLLWIANVLRIPRVVLVGDEKQLDAVDAGKPFAQLQRASMKTATMDEIMRQRDPDLKASVEASLAGDVKKAFKKLGGNVAEVKADNLAGAAAARWLGLPASERGNAGLMAPSHALREEINDIIRERLIRDGAIAGPALKVERLISLGYTRAAKALAANYAAGDVVAFHRAYKRLGVEKGDELRIVGIDRGADVVKLERQDGKVVFWDPYRLAGRTGRAEVYRVEEMELRQGDRIRWTRNDARRELVNSATAEVTAVKDGRVRFRLEDGRVLDMRKDDPQLRHVDRAWASTVHAFQGRTVDTVIAAMEVNHPPPDHAEDPLRRDQPGSRPRRTGHRRPERAARAAGGRHRRAHRGARSGETGKDEGTRGGAGCEPERGPRRPCRQIAAVGTDVQSGHEEGAGAEECRSQHGAVGHSVSEMARTAPEMWLRPSFSRKICLAMLKRRPVHHIRCSAAAAAPIMAASVDGWQDSVLVQCI